MEKFEIGAKVQVTFGVLDGSRGRIWEFESEVMDVVDNDRNQGVWVDHPECRGEDMLFVELTNPYVNKVEIVKETTVNRQHTAEIAMKTAKVELHNVLRKLCDDESIKIMVKVYDCFEEARGDFDAEQTYDVEIMWAIGEDAYTDSITTDVFMSSIEDDEVSKKDAVKRAKSVLRTVKGWYEGYEGITVAEGVEVYHQ